MLGLINDDADSSACHKILCIDIVTKDADSEVTTANFEKKMQHAEAGNSTDNLSIFAI